VLTRPIEGAGNVVVYTGGKRA